MATDMRAAEDALDLPLRKAGLWELQTQTDEGHGSREQHLTMCVGEEMERKTVTASRAENRSNCEKYEVKKTAQATTVDATCTVDTRKTSTHTELAGDFQTTFSVKVESKTSGFAPRAQGGQPVNVERKIVQNGKYLGESCGDLQAGEARTADGRTVIVQ
jgi:hypothetical protein